MPPVARPDTTCCKKMSILVAQVRPADGVVLLEDRRRSRQHHAAGLQYVGVVGQLQRDGGVLLDEQDAHALVAVDRAHDAKDLAHEERPPSTRTRAPPGSWHRPSAVRAWRFWLDDRI